MKIKAKKDLRDKNGIKVFTKGHTYDIYYRKKDDLLAVYCDLKAMYNLTNEDLNDFDIIE